MIDIVIPLRNDSHWQNNEIRYCLRSVEMYLKYIRNVYIVGYKPKFIHNVIHISTNDPHPWVTFNIRDKLIRVCKEEELSDNFLFMNDDHYIMESFDGPTYFEDTLENTLNTTRNSIYRRIIQNTISKFGPCRPNWDTHTPIIMNKEFLPEALTNFEWPNNENEWGGFLIKTTYIEYMLAKYIKPWNLNIKYAADGKVRNYMSFPNLQSFACSVPVLSSGDKVLPDFQRLLNNMFPNKSKYEL